jgi:hypothetical protein
MLHVCSEVRCFTHGRRYSNTSWSEFIMNSSCNSQNYIHVHTSVKYKPYLPGLTRKVKRYLLTNDLQILVIWRRLFKICNVTVYNLVTLYDIYVQLFQILALDIYDGPDGRTKTMDEVVSTLAMQLSIRYIHDYSKSDFGGVQFIILLAWLFKLIQTRLHRPIYTRHDFISINMGDIKMPQTLLRNYSNGQRCECVCSPICM